MNPTQAEIEAALKEMPANNAGYDKWGIWAWYHKDVLRSILSQPEQQEAVGDEFELVRRGLRDESTGGQRCLAFSALKRIEALTATKPAGWRKNENLTNCSETATVEK